jgi:hypothetical protein|tara:strand:- start:295 stop:1098 length:804 start_codon:yes stop_codon:yes gene_type:complete
MKKSQFKEAIKEEILDILSEASPEDVANAKAYNDELEKTKALSAEIDAVSEANDTGNFQDDGYVDKKDVDDTTDLYVHNDSESMAFESKINEDMKSNIMQYWDRTDTMINDLREFILAAKDAGGADLVREIADALNLMTNYAMGEYKKAKESGDLNEIEEANNQEKETLGITADEMKILHKNGKVQLKNGSIVSIIREEDDDEDKEPTSSQLKGDGIALLATKLQQTTKEMKQVVKKWKDAEGQEKQNLKDRLRELTKIKKEIESLL